MCYIALPGSTKNGNVYNISYLQFISILLNICYNYGQNEVMDACDILSYLLTNKHTSYASLCNAIAVQKFEF